MNKRLLIVLALVLVLALSFSLVACGNDKDTAKPNENEDKLPDTGAEIKVPAVTIAAQDFTKGATLESVTLPAGFTWKDKATALKVGKHDYLATYTKDGKSVDANISIEVKKSATRVDEDETVAFIENKLRSDAFKKNGDLYGDSQYDQYVMILARSAKGVSADIKTAYMARVKDIVLPSVDPVTNIARSENFVNFTNNTVPTLLAMGESTVIDGVDLAAPYYNDAIIVPGDANANTYALITVKNLNIPAKYKTKDGVEHTSTNSVDKMIETVLALQNAGGYWEADEWAQNENDDWVITGNKIPNIDNTTNAIIALAEFYDRPAVKTAIDKAMTYINGKILASGALDNFGENISSTAAYITGLTALNIDPMTVKSAEGKSLVDYVASQRIKEGNEKGGYVYAGEYVPELIGTANYFSTKDASISLISYNRYLRGDKNFYEFRLA